MPPLNDCGAPKSPTDITAPNAAASRLFTGLDSGVEPRREETAGRAGGCPESRGAAALRRRGRRRGASLSLRRPAQAAITAGQQHRSGGAATQARRSRPHSSPRPENRHGRDSNGEIWQRWVSTSARLPLATEHSSLDFQNRTTHARGATPHSSCCPPRDFPAGRMARPGHAVFLGTFTVCVAPT